MKTWRFAVSWLVLFAAIQAMADQPSIMTLITNGLFEPYGVTVDSGNNFYLTDNSHRVFKYDYANGAFTVLAGQQGVIGTNNGPGFLSRFYAPKGMAIYGGGLVVADSGNHGLRFITLTGDRVEVVTNFAGVPSSNLPGTNSLAAIPALQARFNNPLGLTASGTNLFIADSKNNAIRRLYLDTVSGTYLVETVRISFIDPASSFFEPSSIAFDDNGHMFVADTRNQFIRELFPQVDGSYQAYCLAGSVQQVVGTNDAFFARDARFNMPAGLLWEGGTVGLLAADSGNQTIRQLYVDQDLSSFFGTNVWSTTTFAGIPKTSGLLDGYLDNALLKAPVQMAKDQSGGILIVDSGNNALRRIQVEAQKPPVMDPKIGYVTIVTNQNFVLVSKLIPFADATFYDDVVLAIIGESQTVTYTSGVTPGLNEPDLIPVPKAGFGQSAPNYFDGMVPSEVPQTLLTPQPDITIKAVGSAEGRRPSALVQARARFKVASPEIIGDNPLSLLVKDITTDADIWFTLDDLVNGEVPKTNVFGPYHSGDAIQLHIADNAVMKVQAFRPNWQNSVIINKNVSVTNFSANRISLGFASGEASSAFVASPGQTFYAPITLSLLSGARIYSLQFNTRIASMNGAPLVDGNSIGFETTLRKPKEGSTPVVYVPIDPLMYYQADASWTTLEFDPTNLVLINTDTSSGNTSGLNWDPTSQLLMVGWMERAGQTNLYDTTKQDLVTYSQAHNNIYLSADGKVILGTFMFNVPMSANDGSQYLIQIARPSATSDGVATDTYIDTPTNGSLSFGPMINSIKNLTIGHPKYIVGDNAPFRWFNAGDFGDGSILNNDLEDLFQRVTYRLNGPPPGSDFFNSMDSASNVILTDASDGSNYAIDNMTDGDGQLGVDDLYVTYRRSLDPTLKWYVRYHGSDGKLHSEETPNVFRGSRTAVTPRNPASSSANLPAKAQMIKKSTAAPMVRFSAGEFQCQPGQTVTIPIEAKISGRFPIRVLLLNLDVVPLNGAPPLEEKVAFEPANGLGSPTYTMSMNAGNYSASWLDSSVVGLWGNTAAGTLKFKIPANTPAGAYYQIVFSNASASPSGIGTFPLSLQNGLVKLSAGSQSSWGDGIPDSWRVRYFGSLNDPASAASADADGDGVCNWAEYVAGTNPKDTNSVLRLKSRMDKTTLTSEGKPAAMLSWTSIEGVRYTVESTLSLVNPQWSPVAINLTGTGEDMECSDTAGSSASCKYYRIRVVP